MRYVGGKARIAGWVADNVLSISDGRTTYLEPFLGSAGVFAKISPNFKTKFAGDSHVDLMEMWCAIKNGWDPPESIDRQVYETQRSAPSSAFRGLVGFGGSFGGKWFGGYADTPFDKHHGRYTKPFYEAARRSVIAIRDVFNDVELRTCQFDDWSVNTHMVIYCDPPYKGTLGYGSVFDHDHFWRVMDLWAMSGAAVIVSERQAPNGWQILAERTRRSMLRVGDGVNTDRIERLFVKRP